MPTKPVIPALSLNFLKALQQNNNREWFSSHKENYLEALAAIEIFSDGLLVDLNAHDIIETASGKRSLHRIYRDTRFSADKTPYKNNWSGHFRRATVQRRGGYYFHVEPGNSYVAGGFWAPDAKDIKRIRNGISHDPEALRAILKSKKFIENFGELKGEKVRTAPKGFDLKNEAIDLLRFKQFILVRKFTDDEILNTEFIEQAGQTFKNMRPFFDYMSGILTFDNNGQSI